MYGYFHQKGKGPQRGAHGRALGHMYDPWEATSMTLLDPKPPRGPRELRSQSGRHRTRVSRIGRGRSSHSDKEPRRSLAEGGGAPSRCTFPPSPDSAGRRRAGVVEERSTERTCAMRGAQPPHPFPIPVTIVHPPPPPTPTVGHGENTKGRSGEWSGDEENAHRGGRGRGTDGHAAA